jgi:hypothetical protein
VVAHRPACRLHDEPYRRHRLTAHPAKGLLRPR